MCTPEELIKKIDGLGSRLEDMQKGMEKTNEDIASVRTTISGLQTDLALFKSNVNLINSTVETLQDFKNASVLKKMEEDIAVLAIMKDLQQSVNDVSEKFTSLEAQVQSTPCMMNPNLYSKFMRELSNEIIDTNGRIFLVLDKAGKVKMINQYGCQLLGLPATKVIGKHWISTFIPEEDRERLKVILETLLGGRVNGYDTVINSVLTKSGRIELRWKNFIFRDTKDSTVAIISMGAKL